MISCESSLLPFLGSKLFSNLLFLHGEVCLFSSLVCLFSSFIGFLQSHCETNGKKMRKSLNEKNLICCVVPICLLRNGKKKLQLVTGVRTLEISEMTALGSTDVNGKSNTISRNSRCWDLCKQSKTLLISFWLRMIFRRRYFRNFISRQLFTRTRN